METTDGRGGASWSRTGAACRGREPCQELEALGTLSCRAAVGHCARRLFGVWNLLGLFSPRSCAQPCVPLGRRRLDGHLRPGRPHVLRSGAVEWPRSYPEGAAVRARERRGQSWRGREGVLLLSRLHADTLVHEGPLQISTGRV